MHVPCFVKNAFTHLPKVSASQKEVQPFVVFLLEHFYLLDPIRVSQRRCSTSWNAKLLISWVSFSILCLMCLSAMAFSSFFVMVNMTTKLWKNLANKRNSVSFHE